MVPYLDCDHARGMLEAFIDGELSVDAQVALESHLRWCRTCTAHVDDLRLIGEAIRRGALTSPSDEHDRELTALQAGVLSRVRVEHEQSFRVQVRSMFDDRHLLWAGLGATTALVFCFFGTMSVLQAASEERPDSLAGVISSLANPGSDRNPLLLDGRIIQMPRALDDSPSLDQLSEEEAVFALAAVMTREGRIANYELLVSKRGGARRVGRAEQARHVTTLLDRVAQSRFSPAEQGVARAPVAVNMVWLLARTTVRGSPSYALDFETVPAVVAAPPVPAAKPPAADRTHDEAAKRPAITGSSAVVSA